MSRLVRLEPPYTRSGPSRLDGVQLPLLRGPRLARTRAMGRWHRPRSGVANQGRAGRDPYVSYSLWCGQFLNRSTGLLFAAELPDNEPLCGTCEGRAIGAGHPPIAVSVEKALLFEPESAKPSPEWCPAGRLHESAVRHLPYGAVFRCPVCGAGARMRAAGGAYDSHVKIEGHLTGPDLIEPCPFHRWDYLRLVDDRAVCECSLFRQAVA